MYDKSQLMFIIVETPLHVGTGREFGIIDMPIQREKHTNFPKIEGSTIKGVLRAHFEVNNKPDWEELFGKSDKSGLLTFSDARILLFPVKSMKGLFAWVTSPFVLQRFFKDAKLSNIDDFQPFVNANLEGTVPSGSNNIIDSKKVILEEFTFEVKENENTKKLAKLLAKKIFPNDKYAKEKLEKNLVILSDDDFRDFVTMSTEVTTRIRIDPKTNTVESGGLFTEEQLPTESVLYTLIVEIRIKNSNIDDPIGEFNKHKPDIMQMGGNNTLGKGFVRLTLVKGGTNGK